MLFRSGTNSVTVSNPIYQIGITGTLPNVTVANPVSQVQLTGTNSVTVSNPIYQVGITGTLPNVTVANPVSQVQLTGTNSVTVTNPVTQVLLTGTNTVTISNPVTQVLLTGTNTVTVGNSVLTTNQQQGGVATVSTIAGTGTSVTLLSANTSRKGLQIFNNSANNMFTKFGTTASLNSFSFIIAASGFYEMPMNYYTGRVDAIWTAAGGSGIVTEIN